MFVLHAAWLQLSRAMWRLVLVVRGAAALRIA